MIRLITVLLTLAVLIATAKTVIAVEPEGWCNCNLEAPLCRSICPYRPVPTGEQGWGYHWHGYYGITITGIIATGDIIISGKRLSATKAKPAR